jgi:hypothetical protein
VPDPDDQAHEHNNLFVDAHDQSSPAVQQGLGRPPNHTYIESADDCADASEGDPGPDTISASDRRHKVLKDRIVRDETAEKTVKYLGMAIRISKRESVKGDADLRHPYVVADFKVQCHLH